MISVSIDPVYVNVGLPALGIGLVLGLLIMWLVARSNRNKLLEELDDAAANLKSQEALQAEREAAFELANAKLTQAFADVSNRSLRANSDTFLKLAEQNLETRQAKVESDFEKREKAVEELVKPIKDALQASHKQISDLEKARSEAYGGIKSQLESMQLDQKSLTKETHNLVKALRRPEVRGQWGEITLRRLVELAGMVEHCDFVEQVHTESDGQIIRPDMIVNMPDQRQLVVDVKTPLDAYLSAAEAEDDVQRKLGLERHAKNVRAHIKMLSTKAYWGQFEESPEFVILFIPGDQFLSAALAEEPDLIEYALSRQIILATPTSFVALLKAVAYGWRQLALADNAKEIRVLAEDLYGRLGTFVTHMNKVGRQLASSVENYNKAVGSLERSVLPGARKFTELGVHGKKDIEKLESLEPVPRTMIEGSDT
ncbi:MAG: DNA recombination protein RmuC [Gammaproteobacteria bacterium]|nr:DNA recombination protein RmuC [Gammaproteobacteria bacterium]